MPHGDQVGLSTGSGGEHLRRDGFQSTHHGSYPGFLFSAEVAAVKQILTRTNVILEFPSDIEITHGLALLLRRTAQHFKCIQKNPV